MRPSVNELIVGPPITSDHLPVILKLNLKSDPTSYYIKKSINYDKLAASLIINSNIDDIKREARDNRLRIVNHERAPHIKDSLDSLVNRITSEITTSIEAATTIKKIKTSI